MMEVKRLIELKALFENHRDSPPDLLERAYRINRQASRNILEDCKERSILAAITKKRR